MIADLARRVRNALAFGRTTAPVLLRDGVPEVQVRLTAIELTRMVVVEQRGVASNLPVGTPVLVLCQAGDRNNAVVVGSTAPGTRPALEGPEDAALYGYGYQIAIRADGVHITGAPDVFVDGNLHVNGDVTAHQSGAPVTLSTHRHAGNNAPPSPGT